MLAFSQLGDFRSDFVGALSIVTGQAKANSIVTGFENLIKDRAKEGALQAIPTIEKKVEAKVKTPLIIVGVLSAVGAATGIVALLIAARRK